jgi:TonB family protein
VTDEAGRVTGIAVDKPCPFGMTEAATEAVERWRYRPATRKGLPVRVYMNLRVEFSLN